MLFYTLDHYDPWGLNLVGIERQGTPDHLFQYNGKERQTELGLNWVQFKWRNHQPDIGRFFNVDPLAESFYYNSTYAFSENKVTAHVELEGLEAFSIHGTASEPSTFTENPKTLPALLKLSGNKTINNGFSWPEGTNHLTNNQSDRSVAAAALANYVLGNMNEGENITLIGHSHGGNVSIQAVNMIQAGLDEAGDNRSIDLITIATPAYNGAGDPENPANTSAASHTHFYSESDIIQTTMANGVGSKTASRTYDNPTTRNVKVNDTKTAKLVDPSNPGLSRTVTVPQSDPVKSHSIHKNPELLKKR